MRIVCLLAMALLAGCGQKGPLYFAPQQPANAEPAEATHGQDQPAAPAAPERATHQPQDSNGN